MDPSLTISQLDDVFKHISDDAFMHVFSDVFMRISDDAIMHLLHHMETLEALLCTVRGLIAYHRRIY